MTPNTPHLAIVDGTQLTHLVSSAHDVAATIRHMAAVGGHDLSPIHEASDGVRGRLSVSDAQPEEAAKPVATAACDPELRTAVEAAKTSPDRPRHFAVAYRNHRNAVNVAHGTEFASGGVEVEGGHAWISGYEESLQELKDTLTKHGRAHHIDYTDEP